MLPEVLEMRDPSHHEDDVQVAFADYLVRDVHVAVLYVVCLRRSGYQCPVSGRILRYMMNAPAVFDINPGARSLENLRTRLVGFDLGNKSITELGYRLNKFFAWIFT